ncbi:MAG: hypothetical protein M0C28_04885 [Candidatus Moduliflexus flocculans]|nr:hypothetical protein [Candidatus Moduliflexus flocculans]
MAAPMSRRSRPWRGLTCGLHMAIATCWQTSCDRVRQMSPPRRAKNAPADLVDRIGRRRRKTWRSTPGTPPSKEQHAQLR